MLHWTRSCHLDAGRTNRVPDTIGVPHIPVGRDQREPLQGHALAYARGFLATDRSFFQELVDLFEVGAVECASRELKLKYVQDVVVATARILRLSFEQLPPREENIYRRSSSDFEAGLRCLQSSATRFECLAQCTDTRDLADDAEVRIARRALGFARRALESFACGSMQVHALAHARGGRS